jgi:glycosyltransferase involved in cell wall biosynthesis
VLNALLAAVDGARIVAGWRRADRILCLGSLELEQMRRRYPRWHAKLGCYVIAPPADERRSLAAVRAERVQRARPAGTGTRFLWLGRWAEHKGTRRLLELMRERERTAPHDSFTLAGTGIDPGLGSSRCHVLPSYRRDELPGLLRDHDAGLFTSDVEGWGISLNEMLEAGLPVFATDAGGVTDLAPYFQHTLRPFPPPPQLESWQLENLEATGYQARFDWDAIAASYEEQVLRPAPAAAANPRPVVTPAPRPQ